MTSTEAEVFYFAGALLTPKKAYNALLFTASLGLDGLRIRNCFESAASRRPGLVAVQDLVHGERRLRCQVLVAVPALKLSFPQMN